MDGNTPEDGDDVLEQHAHQIHWTVRELEDREPDVDRDITIERTRRAYAAFHDCAEDTWDVLDRHEKDGFKHRLESEYRGVVGGTDDADTVQDVIDEAAHRPPYVSTDDVPTGDPDDTYHVIEGTIENALDAVMGDRDDSHGHPAENHATIAALWSAYFGIDVSMSDVSNAFILAKISRHKNGGPDRDHFRDIVGYGGIGAGLEFGNHGYGDDDDHDDADRTSADVIDEQIEARDVFREWFDDA